MVHGRLMSTVSHTCGLADSAVALIPAALRAIADMGSAGILPANTTANASSYADIWESSAAQFFEVQISAQAVEERLAGYVTQANLTTAILYGAGSLNATSNSTDGWGSANQTIGGQNGTFYGLSLSKTGSVVEVNSLLFSAHIRSSTLTLASYSSTASTSRNHLSVLLCRHCSPTPEVIWVLLTR